MQQRNEQRLIRIKDSVETRLAFRRVIDFPNFWYESNPCIVIIIIIEFKIGF